MKHGSRRWLVVALVALAAALIFALPGQGFRRIAGSAISGPEDGPDRFQLCRDGIKFQVIAEPKFGGTNGPLAAPFIVHLGRAPGGPILARGVTLLLPLKAPIVLAGGVEHNRLGTVTVRWSDSRLLGPGQFVFARPDLSAPRDSPAGGGEYQVQNCFLFTANARIDVKPSDSQNRVNPRRPDPLPVAILTGSGFSATKVDPSRVRFGATGTEAPPLSANLVDVDADDDKDVLLRFEVGRTGIGCGAEGTKPVSLTGHTTSGRPFQGSDVIKVIC